jgi:predicted phosphodiesterase
VRVFPVYLPYGPHEKYKIVLAGDFHFGSTQCDVSLIKKFVSKYGGEVNTKVILLGDEIDAICRSDKRFDPRNIAEKYRGENNYIDLIIDDFISIMTPLKGQIIAGVDGNHGSTYRKISDSDPIHRLSRELMYERLGYAGWVSFVFKWYKSKNSHDARTRTINYFVSHGKPSTAQTPGGSINTLSNSAQFFMSDVCAHGHTHRLSAGMNRIMFTPDPRHSTYKKTKQHLVQTGSFLKSYSLDQHSPYSERALYAPIDLGWAVTQISFDEYTEPKIKCWVNES